LLFAFIALAHAQGDGDSTEYIARARGYPPVGVFRCDGQWGCHRKHRHRYYYAYRWGRPYAVYRHRWDYDDWRDRYDRVDERWHYRESRFEVGAFCKDEMIRVVGDTHLTHEGALKAAERHWQATVRYDFGERYMGLDNARGYRFRCDRAETNESTLGKLGEAVSGGEGYRKRCLVLARPCRAPLERGEAVRK